MGKYIKLFNNHNEYTAFTQTDAFVKPNVSHCISENDVHYNPLPIWGAVDLGLPSGTLWAAMNVGATSETDYGLLFAWGETKGNAFTEDGIIPSGTKQYSWGDYELSNGGTSLYDPKLTKYCPSGKTAEYYADGFTGDTLVTLEDSDDAAFVASGGQYRMPTQAELVELTANTTSAWDAQRSGCTFTAQNGNSIFLPAAGNCLDGSVYNIGFSGGCWSSSLNGGDPRTALDLIVFSEGVSVMGGRFRCLGKSVRGVLVR